MLQKIQFFSTALVLIATSSMNLRIVGHLLFFMLAISFSSFVFFFSKFQLLGLIHCHRSPTLRMAISAYSITFIQMLMDERF